MARPESRLGGASQSGGVENSDDNDSLPDFSHLLRYPGAYGGLPGMSELLDTAASRFLEDRTPQVIAVVGHHANGKSTNILHAIKYLEERFQNTNDAPPIHLVTYDETLLLASNLKERYKRDAIIPSLKKLNTLHQSGTRTQRDYKAGTFVLENVIRMAIKGGGIILVEAPATGGFKVHDLPRVGKDRGTTAIRKLAKREGFEELDFDLYAVALVSEFGLFQRSLQSRSSETEQEAVERHGASGFGTDIANKDIGVTLGWFYGEDPSSFQDPQEISNKIAEMFSWILEDYFGIPAENAAVLLNTDGALEPPKKRNLKKYSFIRRMSEGRKIKSAFKSLKDK